MKVFNYVIAVVCGLFGLLNILRFVELLVTGGGPSVFGLVIGVIGIFIAWTSLKKARSI